MEDAVDVSDSNTHSGEPTGRNSLPRSTVIGFWWMPEHGSGSAGLLALPKGTHFAQNML